MRNGLFLVLLPLLATGCAIRTNQPLSDPATARPEASLYGHWVATTKKEGKTSEIHFFIGAHDVKGNPTSSWRSRASSGSAPRTRSARARATSLQPSSANFLT